MAFYEWKVSFSLISPIIFSLGNQKVFTFLIIISLYFQQFWHFQRLFLSIQLAFTVLKHVEMTKQSTYQPNESWKAWKESSTRCQSSRSPRQVSFLERVLSWSCWCRWKERWLKRNTFYFKIISTYSHLLTQNISLVLQVCNKLQLLSFLFYETY